MDARQSKAIRYDKMVFNPSDDRLGLFTSYDEVLSNVRKIILEKCPRKVMEVGCGTANLCGPISEEIDVIGIDYSLEMIMRAKEKYNYMHFKYVDFLEEYESVNDYDLIVSSFFVHCFKDNDRKKVVRKMLRMLDENGKIIIVEYMYKNQESKSNFYEKFAGEKDLIDFLEKKNFFIVDEFEKLFFEEHYIFKAKHYDNLTWIIEIEKKD